MNSSLKPLYLCKSFDELKNLTRQTCERAFRGIRSAKSILPMANKMYSDAVKFEEDGDEEMAFSFYHQYADGISLANRMGDFVQHMNLVDMEAMRKSTEKVEILEENLKWRYDEEREKLKGKSPKKDHAKEDGAPKNQPEEPEEEHECPICKSIPSGKIFQCREGHIICESCLREIQKPANRALQKCPTCSGRLDDETVSRVRFLENWLDRRTFDCCHKKNGCTAKLMRDKVNNHESLCLYGQKFGICELVFGIASCNFKLSGGTAKDAFKHIRTSHPSIKFKQPRFSDTWNLKEAWHAVCSTLNACIKYTNIVQVSHGRDPHYVAIIAKVSKECVSFYTVDVDLSLGLSAAMKSNPSVKFSIAKDDEIQMSWSIPVARGIESWKFLKDENCQKPIEIGVHCLLQYSDADGRVKIDFVIGAEK